MGVADGSFICVGPFSLKKGMGLADGSIACLRLSLHRSPINQPNRSLSSLGDAYLKYPEFNGRPNRSDSSAGRYIPPPYTPPYVTATPEVGGHAGTV